MEEEKYIKFIQDYGDVLTEECCTYHLENHYKKCEGKSYGDGFNEPREWICNHEDSCPYFEEWCEMRFKEHKKCLS